MNHQDQLDDRTTWYAVTIEVKVITVGTTRSNDFMFMTSRSSDRPARTRQFLTTGPRLALLGIVSVDKCIVVEQRSV
jgi:hypothetical protein